MRLRLPKAISPYNGTHNATSFGPACVQQPGKLAIPSTLPNATQQFLTVFSENPGLLDSEDCLTLNVIAPANVTTKDRLPVVVWFFGGGFETGTTGAPSWNGTSIVDRSMQLGEPVIWVSMNYRLSALGFPVGKEVKEAGIGNLGLHDQREALRWVQKYISAFGGDSQRVTIWGFSAGAQSVALQMLTNGGDTEGLFHAAFMQSGSPLPVGDIAGGQQYYDAFVADAGCAGAEDTLACLRTVDIDVIRAAMVKSPSYLDYQTLDEVWVPRADGVFLKDHPQKLVAQGSVANVPMINGDCDDEGSIFAASAYNVTTDAEFKDYIGTYYLKNASDAELERILALYPANVSAGSPFDTGSQNAFTPQSKRIGAFVGDYMFQGPRRYLLEQRSDKQASWSYDNKRLKDFPVLGAMHSCDISDAFGQTDFTDYLLNFVNHYNPNGRSGRISWPQYTTASPSMLLLLAGNVSESVARDTWRKEGIAELTRVSLAHPL